MRFYRGMTGAVLFCALSLGCSKNGAFETSVGGYCELPEVGKAHRVSSTSTGLPAHYRIDRPGSDRIQVTLFLEFQESLNVYGSKSRSGWARGARAFTEQCLAEADPFLVGPSGEKLQIRLATEAETAQMPGRSTVHVTSDPVRGHSRLWWTGWGCPQVMHEVFHFVGLTDEYAEPGTYACRAVGPSDSLMANPAAAYQSVFTGARRSLLYPAQFVAVAYPGCQKRNPHYYGCATQAYRTLPENSCGDRPNACGEGHTDWVEL